MFFRQNARRSADIYQRMMRTSGSKLVSILRWSVVSQIERFRKTFPIEFDNENVRPFYYRSLPAFLFFSFFFFSNVQIEIHSIARFSISPWKFTTMHRSCFRLFFSFFSFFFFNCAATNCHSPSWQRRTWSRYR